MARAQGGIDIVATLVIEDDPRAALYVTEALQGAGHVVHWAATGQDGFIQARTGKFALLIVDRMLPGLDGLTLVRNLRAARIDAPVIFLTTMDDLDARVEGLEAGGDDYLPKPFAIAELVARSHALIRRARKGGGARQTILSAGEMQLDLIARTATRNGISIDLQPQEFKLLEYLVQNAGRAVTRMMLLENVWGLDFDPGTTVVESHMSRLRAKIDRGFESETIHTVRGTGYVLRAP
ncbi:MAG TPA: response regulator transcription factor [Rhizomicrobium sp.]|nr:response regulator transcription factor [Rhizomicrobium sp.]